MSVNKGNISLIFLYEIICSIFLFAYIYFQVTSLKKFLFICFNHQLLNISISKIYYGIIVIHADPESLVKKCQDVKIIKNSSTTKVGKHIACGYSMFAVCACDYKKDIINTEAKIA